MINYSAHPQKPRYSITRIFGGLLLVAVPVFILVILAGSMLSPHAAWQKQIPVEITSANYIPNGDNSYQNLTVETKALPSATDLAIFGWDINVWQDGHNSLVAPGETVQAWALLGSDPDIGTQVLAVSQNPYPHEYHWARWVLFIILSACALICAIFGWMNINQRRPTYYTR